MIDREHGLRLLTVAVVAVLAIGGVIVAATGPSVAAQAPTQAPTAAPTPVPTLVPVGGRIQAENACYVRLEDMPATVNQSGRFGMFGAYNPQTGVLAAAGGAHLVNGNVGYLYSSLYAIALDGSSSWREVPYSNAVGYSQGYKMGCREMTSVQITDTLWASVFGKDGCDNGRFDQTHKRGGDIKVLSIGDEVSSAEVMWQPGGALRLVGNLAPVYGRLAKAFAVWDAERERIVFGQGSFNDKRDQQTQDEVYEARPIGNNWLIARLTPDGPAPSRRYGTCAAYVRDEATGVDGVIVLGGQQAKPLGVAGESYKEVWWLDFSGDRQGAWRNITARFGNMDALGYRREGACTYDSETKHFYSWMGRADPTIADGAAVSTGAWRVDLAALGDEAAGLTWERLAKDDMPGLVGRVLIPSVWDAVNKRMFVIGGRAGYSGLLDTWAIYPGVTGQACVDLDPYVGFVKPTPVPPTAVPTRAAGPLACDFLTGRVPAAVIANALANPTSIQGYDQLLNPNLPEGPANPRRLNLSIRNIAMPWDPVFNPLVFKAFCP